MDRSVWLNGNWQYIIYSFSILQVSQMHVDWSEAFEYEKFLHVKQTIWERVQIVLNISKCRGDGQ